MATPPPDTNRDPLQDLSGAGAERLSRIWPAPLAGGGAGGSVAPAQPSWREGDFAALLRHQLDAPLSTLGSPDVTGGRVVSDSTEGLETFVDLLTHPSPPPHLLVRVKAWAKKGMGPQVTDEGFPVPPEVAGVVYYLAIAAGLARLEPRITRLDDAELVKRFNWALTRPWLDPRVDATLREGLSAATLADHRPTPP